LLTFITLLSITLTLFVVWIVAKADSEVWKKFEVHPIDSMDLR